MMSREHNSVSYQECLISTRIRVFYEIGELVLLPVLEDAD